MSFSPQHLTLFIGAKLSGDRTQSLDNPLQLHDTTALLKYFAIDDLLRRKPTPSKHATHRTVSDQAGLADGAERRQEVAEVATFFVDDGGLSGESDQALPAVSAAAKPPSYQCRTLRVRDVFSKDSQGDKVQLPGRFWSLHDVGTLQPSKPTERIRNYAEKRLILLKFEGAALSGELGRMCDPQNSALYEALIEQADIRFDIVVEDKLLVPLIVRPILRLT